MKYEMVDDKENEQFVSVRNIGYVLYSNHDLSLSTGRWCQSTNSTRERTQTVCVQSYGSPFYCGGDGHSLLQNKQQNNQTGTRPEASTTSRR